VDRELPLGSRLHRHAYLMGAMERTKRTLLPRCCDAASKPTRHYQEAGGALGVGRSKEPGLFSAASNHLDQVFRRARALIEHLCKP
jgi:hypothetical protein